MYRLLNLVEQDSFAMEEVEAAIDKENRIIKAIKKKDILATLQELKDYYIYPFNQSLPERDTKAFRQTLVKFLANKDRLKDLYQSQKTVFFADIAESEEEEVLINKIQMGIIKILKGSGYPSQIIMNDDHLVKTIHEIRATNHLITFDDKK